MHLNMAARAVTPQRAFVFLATLTLAVAVALTIGVSAARAAVVFDGTPGTAAPPATLGGYTMTPFALDARPLSNNVATVPAPTGGDVGFTPLVNHRRIGAGWATWSHGYTGDVYYSNGATSITMTMPTGTKAFYFYAEPNPFTVFHITATTDSGTTSGAVPVDGAAGAKYFGFYTGAGESIVSIQVSSTVDFAVGEFGIAANQPPNCAAVVANKTSLWPPNHKLHNISLSGLTDPEGDPTTLAITGVTQDEVLDGTDDGSTSPDAAAGASPTQVKIRAERSGIGDGRVYEISFTGTDTANGGTCTGSVQVAVPLSNDGAPAVDSGQLYDSFGP